MSFSNIEYISGGGVVSASRAFWLQRQRAGIKTQGDDLALDRFSKRQPWQAAVFTQNQVKAAPVLVSARH
jgi:N-acetylglutamate synthase/N-acetylornithine aminotransferase